MAKYGRVENGQVTEYREFAEGEIPAHKSHLWRIVEDIVPEYDEFYDLLTGPILEIQEDKLVYQYTIFPRPINELKSLVKEEAQRRILTKYPLWKQNNMLLEKLNILQKEVKSIDDLLTLDEIELALEEIKYIRERSNAIELMNPIPSDYMIEEYWE
jgi:hypothetical protein